MGLGKTRQSVIALTVAEPEGPYLVVCPASVKHNWAREIALALGESHQPGSARGHPSEEKSSARGHPSQEGSPQPGSARGHPSQEESPQPRSARGHPSQEKSSARGHSSHKGADVHVVGPGPLPQLGFSGWTIINYDLLKKHVEGLLAHSFKGLVFDEGHYIKNHRSQRSRLARRLATEGAAHAGGGKPAVHVLTGTPLTNRPRDLFPLLQLIGHALGQSFLAFAKRYCDGHKNDYGYWVTNGVSNAAELSVQLQGTMLRRSKDSTLDLPPKQRTWIDVDVDEAVKDRLNDAAAAFMAAERTERGGRMGIALLSGARRRLAVAKVPTTLEYVEGAIEQGEKVILYSCFTHATRRFARALGDRAVTRDRRGPHRAAAGAGGSVPDR